MKRITGTQMIKKLFFGTLFVFVLTSVGTSQPPAFGAGFRASRILGSYPNRQFPSAAYWSGVATKMSMKFPGAVPSGIWIVSLYQDNGMTQFNFPVSGTIPFVTSVGTDYNESYLSMFDTSGVKIWLQVEPGEADMDTLIGLVLSRYKQHPCVVGFGIDVEWYRNNAKVTDSSAARWEQHVKSYGSQFSLFLKHYGQSWMPPNYRGSIMFVDDSQGFTGLYSGNIAMVSEFKSWGAKFSPNAAGFQFGYAVDSSWWKQYPDPAKTIGDALRANIPTAAALFWVDFTVIKVFPPTLVQESGIVLDGFFLSHNFPNPFNPSTTISYTVPRSAVVTITIYDVLGRERETLVNAEKEKGKYSVEWNAGDAAGGMYVVRMVSGNLSMTEKILLVK
ncbi:MAG: T9SS type A sorting domain-containing protein [Bacteroidota bacterium]